MNDWKRRHDDQPPDPENVIPSVVVGDHPRNRLARPKHNRQLEMAGGSPAKNSRGSPCSTPPRKSASRGVADSAAASAVNVADDWDADWTTPNLPGAPDIADKAPPDGTATCSVEE
jgi:hypothetical protein